MNVSIRFDLSTEGRKASILAGGDGKMTQIIEIGPDDADFARALAVARFESDRPVVPADEHDCRREPTRRTWDHIPTAAEILGDLDTRLSARARAEELKAEKVRENTLAVIRDRKTTSTLEKLDIEGPITYYGVQRPDWPYYNDHAVTESPEARAWLEELAAGNEQQRLDAIARQAVAAEKAAREAAEEEALAAAERAELGLREGDIAYPIEDGAITDAPCWETHKRGKNWFAAIGLDPKAPGGLSRRFADKARGDSYYMVPVLEPGEAVEFGADYYTGSGHPSRHRWYGYVVRVDPETPAGPGHLILHGAADGKAAVKAGREYAASIEPAAETA